MSPRMSMSLLVLGLFSTSSGKTVQISVNSAGFNPSAVNANIGDQISLSFTVGAASFTQSSLGQPCVHSGGIDSGTITIASGQGPQPFTFTLTSPDPLFFFNFADQTTTKCKAGFIATINASAQQISEFQNNAKDFAVTSQPSQSPTRVSISTDPASIDPLSVSFARTLLPPIGTSDLPTTIETSDLPTTTLSAGTMSSVPVEETSAETPSTTIVVITKTVPPLPSQGPTSMSLSPSTDGIPSIPTQPPQNTTSASRTNPVVVVIGALLGVVAFLASVFGFVAWKRRRDQVALLPETRPPDTNGTAMWPAINFVRQIRAGFIGVFSRQFRRKHLDKDEKTVTPFVTRDTPSPVEKATHSMFLWERPPSEVTLVQSTGHATDGSAQQSDAHSSLVVNISRYKSGCSRW